MLRGRRGIEATLEAAILAVLLLGSAPARAQQEGVAESLFRQAREEMKQGEARNACPKFEESYRLDPSVGTLLNWGLCEEALGHTATAWTKLRQFVDSAPTGDGRLRLARQTIAKLEAELPWVRLIVDQGTEQVIVQLDGVELRDASLREAIPVDPGEHSATVSLTTGETRETRFQIKQAERLDLRLSPPNRMALVAPSEPAPTSPPQSTIAKSVPIVPVRAPNLATPRSRRNNERMAAYTAVAVGSAAFVMGSVFGFMALRDRSIVREHCPNHDCNDQTGLDAARSGARNETIADVAFGVTALGLATAGVLFWHSRRASAAVSVGANSASLSLIGIIQ